MKVKDAIPSHMEEEIRTKDYDEWRNGVYALKSHHKRAPRIETTGNHDEHAAVLMGDVVGMWDGSEGWVYTTYGYARKVIAQLLQK